MSLGSPVVTRENERARARVEAALRKSRRTWNGLATDCELRGICSRTTIHHWRRERVAAIGCGLYAVILKLASTP